MEVQWKKLLYEIRHQFAERGMHATLEAVPTINVHPEDYMSLLAQLEPADVLDNDQVLGLRFMGFRFAASVLMPEGVIMVVVGGRVVGTANLDAGTLNVG